MNIRALEERAQPWGREYRLHNDLKYGMHVLEFGFATKDSRHYHPTKQSTMLVVRGRFRISGAGGMVREFGPGDFITLTPGTPHQIECLKPGWIVEASTFHDDKDVIRL